MLEILIIFYDCLVIVITLNPRIVQTRNVKKKLIYKNDIKWLCVKNYL